MPSSALAKLAQYFANWSAIMRFSSYTNYHQSVLRVHASVLEGSHHCGSIRLRRAQVYVSNRSSFRLRSVMRSTCRCAYRVAFHRN